MIRVHTTSNPCRGCGAFCPKGSGFISLGARREGPYCVGCASGRASDAEMYEILAAFNVQGFTRGTTDGAPLPGRARLPGARSRHGTKGAR